MALLMEILNVIFNSVLEHEVGSEFIISDAMLSLVAKSRILSFNRSRENWMALRDLQDFNDSESACSPLTGGLDISTAYFGE